MLTRNPPKKIDVKKLQHFEVDLRAATLREQLLSNAGDFLVFIARECFESKSAWHESKNPVKCKKCSGDLRAATLREQLLSNAGL